MSGGGREEASGESLEPGRIHGMGARQGNRCSGSAAAAGPILINTADRCTPTARARSSAPHSPTQRQKRQPLDRGIGKYGGSDDG